jgi:hypothetical protein
MPMRISDKALIAMLRKHADWCRYGAYQAMICNVVQKLMSEPGMGPYDESVVWKR